MTKLIRPSEGRIIGGVCQGIANSLNLDPTVVRVVAAAADAGDRIVLVPRVDGRFARVGTIAARPTRPLISAPVASAMSV